MRATLCRAMIFVALLTTTGCGFHLRGTYYPYQLPFEDIGITPYQEYDPFFRELAQAFRARKIDVHSAQSTGYILRLFPLQVDYFTVAFAPDGQPRREKILMRLQYELNAPHKDLPVAAHDIVTERHRQLNINQNLADSAELDIILREMRFDIIQQLIMQLHQRQDMT